MTRSYVLRALLALLALSAVPAEARREPLTVFAAASLTEAFGEVGRAFTAKSGIPVRFSFASSAVLARQIDAGAPADLFVSADREWMDYVQKRSRIRDNSRVDLLRGRLALVAPAGSRATLLIGRNVKLAEALGRGRLAVGDPDTVPAGKYAKAALIALRVWPRLADRLARTDNVRAALALVARKEVPFGIVYETDARAEPRVRVVGIFPERSHPPIVYPLALTARASPAAAAFHRFLRGGAARAIFRRHGFVT